MPKLTLSFDYFPTQGDFARPNTARQVAQDAYDGLPDDAKEVVRGWAMELIGMVEAGMVEQAALAWREWGHDDEGQLAIWSQLPSGIRARMKR